MKSTSNPNAILKLPAKKTNPLSPSVKLRKSKPKDTSPNKARRAKRRRATAAGNADFNVNFSKIKISESNRVLRSRSRCRKSSFLDNDGPKTDAVSKDHSYSKASRRSPKASSPPTVHLKVFIDLTTNEDSSCERLEGSSKDEYALLGSCRSNKIEILDFDDLELSDSCFNEHESKFGHNRCNPSVENGNLTAVVEQEIDGKGRSWVPMNPESPICRGLNNDGKQNQSRDNSKTDFEKIPIKYGEADSNLAMDPSFSEQSHRMQGSTMTESTKIVDQPKLDTDETSTSPVYLDLDQNRIGVSSPQTISQPGSEGVTIVSPIHFPSGGCFQRLDSATKSLTWPLASVSEYHTGIIPNSVPREEESRSHQSLPLPDSCENSSGNIQSPLTFLPTFQQVFADKMASLGRSKASSPDTRSNLIGNSFSTSGGSVERILSPVVPKQPSAPKNYHTISSPFKEVNNSVASLGLESDHRPQCRIHLVDTPPSFTRSPQPDLSHPRSQSDEAGLVTQRDPTEFGRFDYLKGSLKLKRTRRTRAQMEICRQEMARKSNHRNKRNPCYTSRATSRILDRHLSTEYHRVHNSHPQDFIYSGLPVRFPLYLRPTAEQQQRYADTSSVDLFGAASNTSDWLQPFDSLPRYTHGATAFPLWTVSAENSFSSTDAGQNHREFHTASVARVSSPPSFMQSAFGNEQQLTAVNSQLSATGRRPCIPWQLEHLSPRLGDSNIGSINSMQFY